MMKEKMQEKHITSILDAYKDMKSGGSKTEEPVKKEAENAGATRVKTDGAKTEPKSVVQEAGVQTNL